MRSPAPAPPIAASLILPDIFLGSNYVPMRPYGLIFCGFFFFSLVFGSFLFVVLFFFFSPFQFLLILLFLSLLFFSIGAILRLLMLLFLYFNLQTCILMIYRENPAKIPVWQKIRQSIPQLIQFKHSNCRWHCERLCLLGQA